MRIRELGRIYQKQYKSIKKYERELTRFSQIDNDDDFNQTFDSLFYQKSA